MKKLKIFTLTILLVMAGFFATVSYAGVCDGLSHDDCKKKITELEAQVATLSKQGETLSSQIKYMDTQINLTTARITHTEDNIVTTEEEIGSLTGQIGKLNTSLDHLSQVLLLKITEGYKQRTVSVFDLILDPENAATLLDRLKYMRAAQNSDHFLAVKLERTKQSFEEQKSLREKKKVELEEFKVTLDTQKNALGSQKVGKQQLLITTKNDERVYQDLLVRARAEFAAIQGIVSGAGSETKLREVSKGETIASLISGASCNSSGTHLHFIVQEGGSVINPFNKLKPVDYNNESNGDEFNPSGSWDWPIPPTINFHQGYGNTWFVRNYRWYSFHNGIDISGASQNVSAVETGTLYRGSYSGTGGCALPYVRLVHKDSNIETLYLHVYAQ